MPRATREEERLTEDDIARRNLGPRGVPGGSGYRENDAAAGKEHAEDRRVRRPYCLIALFLLHPHPKMPDIGLSRKGAEDLAAYISALK